MEGNRLGVEFKIRSHVPGYCGYVPGARSENIYGKTYGRITQESTKRQESVEEARFTTTNIGNSFAIRSELLKQSPKQGSFWKEETNLGAFKGSSRSKQSKPRPQKFVPEAKSQLTYEQALRK